MLEFLSSGAVYALASGNNPSLLWVIREEKTPRCGMTVAIPATQFRWACQLGPSLRAALALLRGPFGSDHK